MEILLAIATLLGGIAAIVFFWDRIGPGYKKFSKPFAGEIDDGTNHSLAELAIDQSYGQQGWMGKPVSSAGYVDVMSQLDEAYDVIESGYKDPESLSNKKVLILPTPRGTIVDEEEYENIRQWVYRGGGLLVLGTYLMESHHHMNLNDLVRPFGFEFSEKLIMPLGKDYKEICELQSFAYSREDLWIESHHVVDQNEHEILQNIDTIMMTSSCTIESAAPPELLLKTSEPVSIIHTTGFRMKGRKFLQVKDYVLDKADRATFLSAYQYGAGKVVAVGSWKIFLNRLVRSPNCDNLALFNNIISWLRSESD